MKHPILLAFAVMASLTLGVLAEDKPVDAAGGAEVQAEKGKHGAKGKVDQEAMMNKQLEAIKLKDEALYKELIDLKEKDPAAFKLKMRELHKQQGKAKGKGKGKGKAKGQ